MLAWKSSIDVSPFSLFNAKNGFVKTLYTLQPSETELPLTTAQGPDYKGLYRVAALALYVSGVLMFVYVGIAAMLGPAPTSTIPQFLMFLSANAALEATSFAILVVAFVLLIPSVFALYRTLREASLVTAFTGGTLVFSGIIVVLSNAGSYFWLINIGLAYQNGCAAACQEINQAAGFATSGSEIDILMGSLLIATGLLIFGLAMLKSNTFKNIPAILSIVSGLYNFSIPFWTINSLSITAYPVDVAVVLYGLWSLVVASKLYALRR